MNRPFKDHADATLIRYWNEGDGSISWLTALELELVRRGYSLRKRDGTRRMNIPIPGNKGRR